MTTDDTDENQREILKVFRKKWTYYIQGGEQGYPLLLASHQIYQRPEDSRTKFLVNTAKENDIQTKISYLAKISLKN